MLLVFATDADPFSRPDFDLVRCPTDEDNARAGRISSPAPIPSQPVADTWLRLNSGDMFYIILRDEGTGSGFGAALVPIVEMVGPVAPAVVGDRGAPGAGRGAPPAQ